jgi:hypothetical protein
MYAAQVYFPPLIAIFLGLIVFQLHREKHYSRNTLKWVYSGLSLLFLLLSGNSLSAIRAVESLRMLKAEEVKAIAFYDETRRPDLCPIEKEEISPLCLEREVKNPRLIQKLVETFSKSSPHAPNHEGAHDRYLTRIRLKKGPSIWLILGKGAKKHPKTAWLAFNSNIRDGWHYGVYLNDALYQVLTQEIQLKKWDSNQNQPQS